jgi:ABC-type Zn uptake system ZnuABC Zn-binding protein ZnuA
MTTMTTILSLTVIVGIFYFLFTTSFTMSYATNTTNTNATTNQQKEVVQEDDKLNVVTSVDPITNIVQNIGGDKINLVG